MHALRSVQFLIKGKMNFTKRDKPLPPLEGTLEGKKYVITGANSGIGYQAAKFAAERGADVYLICRNLQKGEDAVKKIIESTKNQNVHLILGQMGEKQEMNRLAEQVRQKVGKIDILVHNAGCMIDKPEYTSDKIERNFATNTLSVYYLTLKCFPLMHHNSKVIVVSSGGMYTEKLITDDIYMEKKFDGTSQYARNKRQQVCMMQQFAKLYPQKGIFVTMHPGWVNTNSVQSSMPDFYQKMKGQLKQTEEGADTINYLAITPNEELKNGGFYYERQHTDKHLTVSHTSYSQKQADQLMYQLKELSGI